MGRRGVGGGGFSIFGATPTRTRTCGVVVWSMSAATILLLARSSVMWVSVHVARPAIVASSKTAESISPHCSTLDRLLSWVDSTRTLE